MHAAIDKSAVLRHESSLSVRSIVHLVLVAAGVLVLSNAATAFQIAPMGSAFESKLTNETENSLATVAGRLGVLIKGRVHEEITQIGMGCPIEPGTLAQDVSCSSRDLPVLDGATVLVLPLQRCREESPDPADRWVQQDQGQSARQCDGPLAFWRLAVPARHGQ